MPLGEMVLIPLMELGHAYTCTFWSNLDDLKKMNRHIVKTDVLFDTLIA